ncbi:PHP domain-containing protein [Candidatus Pacearchaeota archaeon]|nr:PHP domain-containing protein [Candidatus Pacearchaeota archaeon]
MLIDLHTHTTASDGEYTPKEIIDYAVQRGLSAIAVTDHETINGLDSAIKSSKDKNIEFVPGIELGSRAPEIGLDDVHIVGLFIDPESEVMKNVSVELRQNRIVQKEKIIEKLNSLGYEITFEELDKEASGGSYGRPHIAHILMRKYPNEFSDTTSVFKKLLSADAKAYVPQKRLSIKEAIESIHQAKGIAILAHPALCFEKDLLVINRFIECGGDGIEVNYGYKGHEGWTQKDEDYFIKKYRKIAHDNDLLISGGTDFHSLPEFPEVGINGVTKDEFEKLKRAARR